MDMERLTTLPAPEGYPATFGVQSISIDQQLSDLFDVLNAIRADMTNGVMPRAARLTGTDEKLRLLVQQVDAAIHIGREVVLMLEARGARSRSNAAPTLAHGARGYPRIVPEA